MRHVSKVWTIHILDLTVVVVTPAPIQLQSVLTYALASASRLESKTRRGSIAVVDVAVGFVPLLPTVAVTVTVTVDLGGKCEAHHEVAGAKVDKGEKTS